MHLFVGAVAALAFAGGLFVGWLVRGGGSSDDEAPDALPADAVVDEPGRDERGLVAHVPEPGSTSSGLGLLFDLWRIRQYLKKREKMARKGYVQWFLVDGSWPATPTYVKPSTDGSGLPELSRDGGRYLFPEDAAIPDSATGIRTVVHKKGQLDPVNVATPSEVALKADVAEEWLQLQVTSSAPSGLAALGLGDMSKQEMVQYGIMAIIGFVVIQQFL